MHPLGPRLRMAGWISGVLGLAAVIGISAHLGDIEHFMRLMEVLAPEWLLLACALQAATYLCVAGSWRLGLSRSGIRPALPGLLSLALQKLFIDQTLPSGGMSGTAYLVGALSRRGVPGTAYLATLLADLVAHYGAYLAAAAAGMLLLWLEHALYPWMIGVTAVFSVVALAVPAVVLSLRRLGRHAPHWLQRIPGVAPMVDAFADAPMTLVRQHRVVATMTVFNGAVLVLDALTLWSMLHALSAPVAFRFVLPSFVLATMVAMLGPIPMGLGTFEATCTAALVMLHVPIEAALTATLLLRGWTTWLPMAPGLLLVRREMRRQRPAGLGRARAAR